MTKQIQAIGLNAVGFESKESIVSFAQCLAQIPDLKLAAPGYVDDAGGKRVHAPYDDSIEELIDEVYKYRSINEHTEVDFNIRGPEMARFWAICINPNVSIAGEPLRFEIMISATMHTRLYSEVIATVSSWPDGDEANETVSVFMRDIAMCMYEVLRPHFTWLGFPPASFNRLSDKDVLELKFKELHWLNLFASSYVDEYGEEYLMQAPVYWTEGLGDGGVSIQLAPSLFKVIHDYSIDDITDYFSSAGLEYLVWPEEVKVDR